MSKRFLLHVLVGPDSIFLEIKQMRSSREITVVDRELEQIVPVLKGVPLSELGPEAVRRVQDCELHPEEYDKKP